MVIAFRLFTFDIFYQEAKESLAALQEKLDHANKEHIEKMMVMEQNLNTSEAKWREELENFKKLQHENEDIQRQKLLKEFNSNVEAFRQEYEEKISSLQQEMESAKEEWSAETESLTETLLKKSQDLESLHEEIARLKNQHEAEVRDLEEQLEVNSKHFEMERERLLLLQDELEEQLALKENYLQDVQEEEEDLNKNGAQKATGCVEMVDSSTLEEPNNEMDRMRLTLQDLQSQNTMLQEELTFLSNVKNGLEDELQHLKEEFSVEKEELEFKINELHMTKEDGNTCLEKKVHSVSEERTIGLDQHDQELQTLKELHQTEMKELERRLISNAEHEKAVVLQEIKDWRLKCEALSEEKNAVIIEYEHTKEILKNLELDLANETNALLQKISTIKEQAALSVQELQEQLSEKDRLIENLKTPPDSLEQSSQTVLDEEIVSQPQMQQEESFVQVVEENCTAMASDKQDQMVEKLTADIANIRHMDIGQIDIAQLRFQKLEDLLIVFEEALEERQSLTSHITELESQLSSSIAEKDQLVERCSALVKDLAALQAVEEQSQVTVSHLTSIANEEKTELQKELQSLLEERDALRKDLETSERKLHDAKTHISEMPVENEDSSVLLDHPSKRVQEEEISLTQPPKKQATVMESSQDQAESSGEGNPPDAILKQGIEDLQEDSTEIQMQNVKQSKVVGITEVLLVKEHKPSEDTGAQETDDMKSFQQKLDEQESIIKQLKEEISLLQVCCFI